MVVIFGSINADLVARVVHLPREGETQAASGYAVHAGGKGANQALAARRAGAEVTLVGAVGRDGHAVLALRPCRAAGVSLDAVRAVDGPTGLALIHVDDAGRNTITIVPGANAALRAADLPDRLLDANATLVLQFEVPLPEVLALAQRARKRGARVILNVAPALSFDADALLRNVDTLVLNEHEAEAVAGAARLPAQPDRFAAAVADRWRCDTVVTLGVRGALAATRDAIWMLPAPAVAVVDTTAAGDAFVGAYAAALDRGAGIPETLADAIAAASHACTHAGAQPSIGAREAWIGEARIRAGLVHRTIR